MSDSTQGIAERAEHERQAAEAAWYERHLRAIFHGPCTCRPDGCLECEDELFCRRHDDTCPACVAEHALYIDRDHPHPAVVYDEARRASYPLNIPPKRGVA